MSTQETQRSTLERAAAAAFPADPPMQAFLRANAKSVRLRTERQADTATRTLTITF